MGWVTGALSLGGSLLGGLLNKPPTTTTHSTATPTLSPEMQQFQAGLLKKMQGDMADPTAGTGKIRTAGRNAINRNYAGADQALRDKLLASGSPSGKYGTAQRKVETSRASALSSYDGDIASLILGQQNNNMSLSERLLQQNTGTTNDSTTKGSAPIAGGFAGGAVSGGLSTLTTLMTLNKFMEGGGGGGGGGGGYSSPWGSAGPEGGGAGVDYGAPR